MAIRNSKPNKSANKKKKKKKHLNRQHHKPATTNDAAYDERKASERARKIGTPNVLTSLAYAAVDAADDAGRRTTTTTTHAFDLKRLPRDDEDEIETTNNTSKRFT